jgi:uncharacterized protein
MKYSKLGRTNIKVSTISLGAEHLEFVPYNVFDSVMSEAIDSGINYIDFFLPSPDVRDNFGKFLQKNKRENIIIAGHMGSAFKGGQYYRTQNKKICKEFFYDLLKRLKTEYLDVLMFHCIDGKDLLEKVFNSNGLIELALELKQEGRVRFLGIATHTSTTAIDAINTGLIDVLMFPVNPAFDIQDGSIRDLLDKELYTLDKKPDESKKKYNRHEVYYSCDKKNIGLVAMKPYAAGRLLNDKNFSNILLTPVQCLHYVLTRPGVSTVVPGFKNVYELKEALKYLDASEEDKDFNKISSISNLFINGKCVYCNHCLPCPAGINIGETIKLVDLKSDASNSQAYEKLKSRYDTLSVKASECKECKACTERCPFGVDIILKMKESVKFFEK